MVERTLFKKVLIANRGEIACRVIRTLKRLDIETIAVYSDADRHAQHVLLADEAYWIGSSAASESYLNMDRLFEVAQQAGADAIHPGYGFLSENANFARRCASHGIILIGPPASAMVAMGSKAQAKLIMQNAEVPLVPGYHGDEQDAGFLLAEARQIGFPVLLKASLGGGGKGMRLVYQETEFDAALSACQREARSSFGDDHILIEKYINQPRHVEIQVFADQYGNAVYLFERDCSIQRRHQKVIEEAPAPGLQEATRKKMGEAAVRAAKAIGYVGAGTIEFLLDASGEFYFMEMNTRLQVEHPVTEMITGQDLVEWQIRVAEGNPLPLTQSQLKIDGHSIEVRIYAEDPANEFLPSTGVIHYLNVPTQSDYVRIDSGVVQGDEISVFYDPMIAKLIVWDQSRDQAIHRMQRALRQFNLGGLKTNIGFLKSLIDHPAFQQGQVSTHFIDDYETSLLFAPPVITAHDFIFAALYLSKESQSRPDAQDPWRVLHGWQLNTPARQHFCFRSQDSVVNIELCYHGDKITVMSGDRLLTLQVEFNGDELVVSGDISERMVAVRSGSEVILFKQGGTVTVTEYVYEAQPSTESSEKHLKAPMNGRIVQVAVKPGDKVKEGDLLITVEAMKMEHGIRALKDGVVAGLFFEEGSLVNEGDELVEMEIEQED
ncbi:MAG: acetyl/propionyl/methylcrotonyl-CoA carboxylase subunit alpha [Ketobacter sp.]|nr:acetyl/propionyl/methylcrotonyl-CoA carboxylase subunit alpha [Ketobacter sp.]